MPISIQITADTVAELHKHLSGLLDSLSRTTPYPETNHANGVDTSDTIRHGQDASPVDPAPIPAPKKGKVRPVKDADQVVGGASPDPQPVGPGEATIASGVPDDPTAVPAPAPAPQSQEDEIKAVVGNITSIVLKDKVALDKVSKWRDERGLKWMREMQPEHLADARVLLTQIGGTA